MYKYANTTKIFSAIMVILFAFFVLYIISASALAYVPLEPSIVGGSKNVEPSDYIQNIYQIGIGIAGALAVLILVIGGIKYIASAANPSLKGEAKAQIWAAIGGLILALFSYIILNTINPDLVNFSLKLDSVDIPVSDKTSERAFVEQTNNYAQNTSIALCSLCKETAFKNLVSCDIDSEYYDTEKCEEQQGASCKNTCNPN